MSRAHQQASDDFFAALDARQNAKMQKKKANEAEKKETQRLRYQLFLSFTFLCQERARTTASARLLSDGNAAAG